MNPKEALLQIRALFEDMPQVIPPVEPVTEEVTKVEMAEYSLADGTKVMISALEVGGKVEMEDGTPAPMGEHQLMDGTSIQVDETGTIIEITSPKEDIIEEEPIQPVAPAQDNTAMVTELRDQKIQLETKIAELESKVKQGFAQVAELVEALSNTPTAEPTQKAANAFQSYVSTKDTKYERLEKYRNAILNK
jgi:hypothetical protein